jgi:hypothetical protein
LLASDDDKINHATVANCFAASGGSIRETLFLLYDRYEGRSAPTA